MPRPFCRRLVPRLATLLTLASIAAVRADSLDDIGVRILWSAQPGLNGAGVNVAQPEATTVDMTDPKHPVDFNDFQVNPSFSTTNPPIVYINDIGAIAITFPNNVGLESSHADQVGQLFYGDMGPAPGVGQVLNYNANYYIDNIIGGYSAIDAAVVNQSFIFTSDTPAISIQIFDNYVDLYNTIIVAAAGNGGPIQLPGTAYNVITVSAYNGNVSQGTSDGRSKPDITAPGGLTSFSTPLVSGVATLLVQAGRQGAGGPLTTVDATDNRTIKALLLTGASKPLNWSHTSTTPLDPVYGAGLVNANASYRILAAGEFKPVASGPATLPPVGWNLQNITSSSTADAIDNYPITLQAVGSAFFTATLVWDRPIHDTSDMTVGGINNLDLLFINTATNTQIAASVSTVDNVEHIYLPSITAGTYDIEVLKHGGAAGNPNWVSDTEKYSLAWSTTLYGDINDDGKVDAADLLTLLKHYNSTESGWSIGDLNGDNSVGAGDLLTLLKNYNQSLTPAASPSGRIFALTAAVPEPASLAVLASVALLLAARRTRCYAR